MNAHLLSGLLMFDCLLLSSTIISHGLEIVAAQIINILGTLEVQVEATQSYCIYNQVGRNYDFSTYLIASQLLTLRKKWVSPCIINTYSIGILYLIINYILYVIKKERRENGTMNYQ